MNPEICRLNPFQFPQFDVSGRQTDDHILPSCIAWKNGKLLVGDGAKRLKSKLDEGKSIWVVFQNEIGGRPWATVSIFGISGEEEGIFCYRTSTRCCKSVFSHTCMTRLKDYAQSKDLPARIYSSVSVPSFF